LIVFIKNMCQFSSRKEQNEGAISSRDLYSKAQRERMDNLDQANQEIDRLRKQVDKLQAELQGKITKILQFLLGHRAIVLTLLPNKFLHLNVVN
jgi:dsDNA-specific endonuclease/ATPase MutS2